MNRMPFVNPSTPVNTCHQEHQHWQQIISQQEEEIRQLRSLLLEVMDQRNYHSLRHNALDYYQDLNHLQTGLTRLRRDFVCEGVECKPSSDTPACVEDRFDLSATVDRHAATLTKEFTRIKDGCLQFLSGMMSLNLL